MEQQSNIFYYFHDGNKNVSDVVSFLGEVRSHYSYSPFGALDIVHSYSYDAVRNMFRYSSEYLDDEIGNVYYNFRSLNPVDGRWIGRDPGEELFSYNLYFYLDNRPIGYSDWLGLDNCRESNSDFTLNKTFDNLGGAIGSFSFSYHRSIWQRNCYIKCNDCKTGFTIERNVLDGGGAGAVEGIQRSVNVSRGLGQIETDLRNLMECAAVFDGGSMHKGDLL